MWRQQSGFLLGQGQAWPKSFCSRRKRLNTIEFRVFRRLERSIAEWVSFSSNRSGPCDDR